jgi:plasmid stability protein
MATLQVKGLDDDLYRALKAMAARENRSLSQQVVTLIKAALSHPRGVPRQATEAFLELAGTWEDPRAPEEIARELRTARHARGRSQQAALGFEQPQESKSDPRGDPQADPPEDPHDVSD